MQHFRGVVAGLLVGALVGACSEQVSVHVNCVSTAAPAIECDVVQSAGKSEVEACWDFTVTCANGAQVKAERTCQKVKDGATVKAVIPADKLTGMENCGGQGAPRGEMSGLTINGKS